MLLPHRYPAGAGCPRPTEASTIAPAFEKRKSFIARSTSQETRGKSPLLSPQSGVGVKFKGFGEFQTWKMTGFVSNQSIQATQAAGSQVFLTEGPLALERALVATVLFFEFCRLKILGSGVNLRTRVPVLHMCRAVCQVTPGLISRQPVLREQNQLVNVSGVVPSP